LQTPGETKLFVASRHDHGYQRVVRAWMRRHGTSDALL
jgi:hypothetical protein